MKRGLGHIEVIIAFLMFMGFIFFGLYFFNPLKGDRVLSSTLDYAVKAIEDNVSSDLLVYGITLRSGAAREVSIDLSRDSTAGAGVRVETINGRKLNSDYGSGTLYFDRESENFVYTKFGLFSPGGTPISNPISLQTPQDYNLSSSDRRKVVSEESLNKLVLFYNDHYTMLKKQFNLPQRVEFAFMFTVGNESIGAQREVPQGVETYAREEHLEFIRNSGETMFGDLIVRVW